MHHCAKVSASNFQVRICSGRRASTSGSFVRFLAGSARSTSWVGRLVRRFCVRCTVPTLASCCTAVVLLYTHGGFVGCCSWMGISAVYSCALLLYDSGSVFLLCTVVLYCCTAVLLFVIQGRGWVDRFVGVSTGSWVILFFPRYTGPTLA